jgi:uncharacterized SAM-binding protein YcdF (DUF218 family)
LAFFGLFSLSIIVFSLFIIHEITNPNSTKYLQQYDAIVVLSGNPERAVVASKLFYDKSSKVIFLSKEKKVMKNSLNPRESIETYKFMYKILLKNNVPEDKIILFGTDNTSTFDEINNLIEIDSKDYNAYLIVSNKYHIFRINQIFNNYKYTNKIHYYFTDNAQEWWKDKYSIKVIILEYFKTILYYIFGDFSAYQNAL